MSESFRWRDAERTIVFASGSLERVVEDLRWHQWDRYELLSTPRAMAAAPVQIPGHAAAVHEVPPGAVNEIAAELIGSVTAPALVALGGGRVIDTAKAIAAVRGGRVAAIPTSLSGAPMTAIHKLPDGHSAPHNVRPRLVFADPAAMTGQPERDLRASAMNALAHGADSLYTPLANPVARMAALRGAALIAEGLDAGASEETRSGLALGAILTGYAIDSARFSLHHVICQSIVRTMRIPHAETNAAVLPQSLAALSERARPEMAALAEALGVALDELPGRAEELAGGRRGLGEIGADRARLDRALDAMLDRPELQGTPDTPDRDELARIVEAAW